MIARKGVHRAGWGSADTQPALHPYALCPAARALGLLALLLTGAALLRVIPWLANYPLHRDEALYGFWAQLIATGRDPWLLGPWIDKPPLSLYLTAGSLAAFGASEWALRLPGMIASLLTVPTTYALAARAYGAHTARLAAGLLALSPFAILFAPTAFTDPWLTLWLVAAAWAALAGRSFAAGLALGLAVASKQQGVLAVPLVLALLAAQGRSEAQELRNEETRQPGSRATGKNGTATAPWHLGTFARQVLRTLLGFALIFGPLILWDSLRWHNRPSFWDQSLTTYNPLAVAHLDAWPTRALEWVQQLRYLFGSPPLSAVLLGLALVAGGVALTVFLAPLLPRAWRSAVYRRERRGDGRRLLDVILTGYVLGYLALHVVVTFQAWDRYLLPIVPLICILAGRGARQVYAALQRWIAARLGLSPLGQAAQGVLMLVGVGWLVYAAWLGAAGRIPVGSDHGAYTGIAQVVAHLRAQPTDAIIYDHALGWYYDFYLFDRSPERRWYDSGEKLATDAAATAQTEPGRQQWLALPQWELGALAELRPALAARRLAFAEAERIYRPDGSRSFTLYRIVGAAQEVAP